jgi:hypothetical protein
MGIMNRLEVEIAEGLGVSPTQLLSQINSSELDKDWQEHTTLHVGHPSANCSFCLQDADEPDPIDEMDAQIFAEVEREDND